MACKIVSTLSSLFGPGRQVQNEFRVFWDDWVLQITHYPGNASNSAYQLCELVFVPYIVLRQDRYFLPRAEATFERAEDFMAMPEIWCTIGTNARVPSLRRVTAVDKSASISRSLHGTTHFENAKVHGARVAFFGRGSVMLQTNNMLSAA